MCDCCDKKQMVVVIYDSVYPKVYDVYSEHTFRKIFTEEVRAIPDEEYVALTDLVDEYIEVLGDDESIEAKIREVQ